MNNTEKTQGAIDLTELARSFARYNNSCDKGDLTNANAAEQDIKTMLKLLPSGSGLDSGVHFVWTESKPNHLVFKFDYHHMNSQGSYDGWTKHKLIITPSFVFGFEMRITGRDKNDTKQYLYDLFSAVFWY
jgi:hypothetical protein